jgi:hypothetical protein
MKKPVPNISGLPFESNVSILSTDGNADSKSVDRLSCENACI